MELYKLINSFCKNHPDIEGYALKTLFMSDPTFKETNRGLFIGKYGVWIGNMYVNGNIKLGDIPELKAALITYNKNKSQLPSINDCKSLSELISWVKDLSDDFKPIRKQSNAKENLEKVYEDNEWVVYVPHSHAAARRGGEGTRWCTASENDYYYNCYSKQGPLYINIRKSDGAKFQFHFESNLLMDANDKPVILYEIGLSEGVVDFYTKIDPKFKFRFEFDWIKDFKDGFAIVSINDKLNFIDTNGELLSQQWFDGMWNFSNKIAKVYLNGKYNFINTEGKILSQQWLDNAWNFMNEFARVQLNGNWNFINTDGQLLSKEWFDDVWYFNDGFARVELNNKWNFINIEGQLLSKQWFDVVNNFNEGFARIRINNKWNFINIEGKLLSKQWFDDVGDFHEEFAIVKINNKFNFVNTDGQLLLSKQWFDSVGNFNDGFAVVKINNKYNFINTNGQLLSQQYFDNIFEFNNYFTSVQLYSKLKPIDTNGNFFEY